MQSPLSFIARPRQVIPVRRLFLFLLLAGLALLGVGYGTATADPVVRETEIFLAGWPEGEAAVRAVLISDLHVAGPDMPPRRLARIVGQIEALRPDMVLIAGDEQVALSPGQG